MSWDVAKGKQAVRQLRFTFVFWEKKPRNAGKPERTAPATRHVGNVMRCENTTRQLSTRYAHRGRGRLWATFQAGRRT